MASFIYGGRPWIFGRGILGRPQGRGTHMHELDTPFKLVERFGDYTGLTDEQNERQLSRLVYSGRVRPECSPGVPYSVQELRAWCAQRKLPEGYLPWMGINVADVLKEVNRPRPRLVAEG